MFWDRLYTAKENVVLLFTFVNYVSRLGNMSSTFAGWCDDIPAEFMRRQVDSLLAVLELRINQLKNTEINA